MPTRRIRSKESLVTVVRDTTTRNAATEVYATPIPVQENEITIEKLGYHAVDASALDIAAVSSQKFAVGAFLPAGEGIQRVPAPLRDYEYWIDVIDGDIELHKSGIHADEDIINVSADPSGVTMTPTATDPARIYLTGRLRRPTSSKLYVDVTATERASATIGSVTTASPFMRINTTAAHVVVIADTVTISDSSRTISLTTGFSGHPSTPVITIVVPTGHGIADGESLTLTTTGNIATHLPSGTYEPVVVSATQLQITGVVPGPTIPGTITGTMSVALSAGWIDGTYFVQGGDPASYIEVDQPASRYTGGRTIGTNAAFSDGGKITPVGPPAGSVRVVWWATDELATNHRYTYPDLGQIINLESNSYYTTYKASSVIVNTSTGKATLTLIDAHDMNVGELVNVSGTTAISGTVGPLDGQFVITDVTTYTISWVTTETAPTTARSLSVGGENVGRARLEVYDYAVYIELDANTSPILISQANVFEVVGSTNSTAGGNTVQLSPSGFSLVGSSSTGGESTNVQITNDTDTILKIQEYSETDRAYKDTATIYSDGTISGVLLKGDEINIDGVDVVGNFADSTAVTRNGAAYSSALSLLNRLPRGVIYHGRWSQPTTLTMAALTGAQEYVVSHGNFTLDNGRAYRVELTTGGIVVEQPSRLVFAEVRFSTTPFTSGNYGTSYHLSSYAGGSATTTDWSVIDGLSGVFHASSAISVVTDNYRLPSGVPIYWSFILRTANTISTAITVSSRASNTGTAATALIVEDIGPSLLNDSNLLSTSATYVGALTTAGGPGTTTYTATKTITATETAYFDNYGRGSYGTSDPYTNQYSLYQGNPGTASGTKKSAIEFPALGLTGTSPTITGMRLWLKNRHTYDGSCVVGVGAHGVAELSSTLPTARTTPARVTRTFSSGEGAWITLPSSWYAEFLSGASDGVLIGITNTSTNAYDSTLSNYGYFDGVGTGMTSPPRLEVTWTYTA